MKKNHPVLLRIITALFVAVLSVPLVLSSSACSLFGKDEADANALIDTATGDDGDPAEHPLCAAVGAGSTAEFLDGGNKADFLELNDDQSVFLFTSGEVENAYDGKNVVQLTHARVDFDYEDGSVDPGDLGGFYARWKVVIIPFEEGLSQQLQNADSSAKLGDALKKFLGRADRTEVQIPGPFLENGCEWGDTDQIGAQELTYSDYGVYDWDFFPATDRILGIVYEGDDGVHDDVIGWLDVSKDAGAFTLKSEGSYQLDFESLSDVAVP